MDVLKLKEQIKSITDLSSIFLLEALSDNAGLFANDGKLLYIAKDIYNYPCEGIETEYLKLQTHVRISAVRNNQTFEDNNYNLIVYKGTIDDDTNFESFVQICTIYSKNSNDLNFKEFFYSLITLFQLPEEQKFKNALGLFGELKFMEYVYKNTQNDISCSWHKKGPFSKYDFSNGETAIEIKTTLSEQRNVAIKHQQIFSDHKCYLAILICEQSENGQTVEELVSSMFSNPLAFNGVNFSINLARELKRISNKEIQEIRLRIKEILFFDPDEINPFSELPDNVTELSYRLDFSELTPYDSATFINFLKHF